MINTLTGTNFSRCKEVCSSSSIICIIKQILVIAAGDKKIIFTWSLILGECRAVAI
jgi:hypothetical protein